MSQYKRFLEYRGINVSANDIVRQDGFLRDALNVRVDDDSTYGVMYRKRPGFETINSVAGDYGLYTYFKQDELVSLADTPQIYDGVSTTAVNTAETDPLAGAVDQIADTTEINGVMYIAKEGKEILKYDGHKVYKAGMPVPSRRGELLWAGVGGHAAGFFSYILELEYTDHQENVVLSDGGPGPNLNLNANDSLEIIASPLLQWEGFVSPQLGAASTGFDNVYAEVNTRYPAGASTSDNGLTVTIPVLVGHTISVGDRVYLRNTVSGFDGGGDPRDLLWDSFEVTGTTATSITVDNPKQKKIFVELRNHPGTSEPTYISSTLMNVYRAYAAALPLSDNFYYESLCVRIQDDIIYEDAGTEPLLTSDPYISPEFSEIVPNRSKYIEYHKDILFTAGTQVREEKEPTTGGYVYKDREHEIFYSSTDGLRGLENFVLGGNSLIIGHEEHGAITGLRSHNDFLIIFKKNGIHHLGGDVITGSFRVDEVHGSDVGCIAHGSIQEVNGSVVFLSERGVYAVVGGGSPSELSKEISPLLLNPNLELEKATSAYSFVNQEYYLFIPLSGGGGKMFVFNHDYGSWVVWDVTAEGGLAVYNNEVYTSTGGDLIHEQETRTDDYLGGSAINAYVFTNFHHLGNPSIQKKFINIKAFSLNDINYTLSIESFKDWDDTTVKTSNSIDFTATQRFDKVKVLAGDNKCHSFAVKFSNNVVGEDMGITGWELEYETPYGKMKE